MTRNQGQQGTFERPARKRQLLEAEFPTSWPRVTIIITTSTYPTFLIKLQVSFEGNSSFDKALLVEFCAT